MTCIVGIVDKHGKGHIASDSLGSNGHTKGVYKNKKVFRKANMLIGYTSSFRMGQLIEHSLVIPDRKINQSLDSYLYVDFIEAVRNLFKKNGFMSIHESRENAGEFIVITEGRIFNVQADLSILESEDNFMSCGSGEDYATATMYALVNHTTCSPKTILHEAVKAASRYVSSVGGEVQYISEKDKA